MQLRIVNKMVKQQYYIHCKYCKLMIARVRRPLSNTLYAVE